MNCLIVDDNQIARTTLKQLASMIKDLVVIGEADNAFDAYNLVQEKKVDLVLLDIEMPGMSGLELTRNLKSNKPLIIFTTSKKEYAAEAFELNVADYIVKPVTPGRFIQAVDKVREIMDSNKEEVDIANDSFLFIRDSNIVRKLSLKDILYAEAMGDYVKLHTANKYYAVHSTLKSVEQRLPASAFIRIHRSYIIALDKIETIQEGAVIINNKPLPIADVYRATLNKRLNII